MKKLLFSLLLIPSLLFGAAGDVVSVTIGPEGYYADVVIAGLSDGGTYSNGFGSNNKPSTGTPKMTFAVTSDGYTGTTLGTVARTSYGTKEVRTPHSTSTIAGSHTTGTFVELETVTQTTSGATAVLLIPASAGPRLFVRTVAGTPNTTDVWTGVTSGATFTPTAIPVTYNYGPREHEDGTNLKIRVALSDPIYNDDTLTVNILSGFYTEAGGDGGTANNATTSTFAVTNNSTLDYPVGGGQWDTIAGVRHCDRVSGDYDVAFNARHPWGVAAVRFDALGGTSAATDTETVTTITQTRRSGTGLYLTNHKATFQVAGFTSGESIALRARIYPKVGDADSVFDTDSYTTANDEVLGVNKPTIVYNTSRVYAYVNVTTGNNGTGVASTTEATAAASPFQHIGEAIEGGGTLIKLEAGTHPAVGNVPEARVTTNEWRIVQPADGLTSSDVTVQINATIRTYKVERLQFNGVKVTLADTSSWMDGDAVANYLRWTSCVFDSSGVGAPTTGPGYRSYGCYFENCTGDLGRTGWSTNDFGAERQGYTFDGCTLTSTGTSAIGPWYRFSCNTTSGSCHLGEKSGVNPLPSQANVFCENNKFIAMTAEAVGIQTFYQYAPTMFVSICGNIWERTTSGNPPLWFAADGRTVNCDRGIICNNTTTGDRWNICYNDNGTTSRTLSNVFERNNITEVRASKHDDFPTESGARVGAWWSLYGCGMSGNFMPHTASVAAAGDFMIEFAGLNGWQPTPSGHPLSSGADSAQSYTQFVTRAAYTGSTGAGNGDYRIHTGSPAYALATGAEPFFPYDLNGKPRSRNNDNPGAIAEGGARRASMFFAN